MTASTMSPRDAFIAGMLYAAGPRATADILGSPEAMEVVERLLDPLALSADEMLREHRGW